MLGGIYTDQKCGICNGSLVDNGRGLSCPFHKKQTATKFRVYFKDVSKRFKTYQDARIFLSHLQATLTYDNFDSRDYKKDNPLSFKKLAYEWLGFRLAEAENKRDGSISMATYKSNRMHIDKLVGYFGETNVKDFKPKDFDAYINTLTWSSKTVDMNLRVFRQLFSWIVRNDGKINIPDIPSVKVRLARRKVIKPETQNIVLEKIKELTFHNNPKIWFGTLMAKTYFNVRPKEMVQIKEKDIDLDAGEIFIPPDNDKCRTGKMIYLIPRDIEILKNMPTGFPEQYFFRHTAGSAHYPAKEGDKFGRDLFNNWWKHACADIGLEGVTFYPGTRHSTVTALRAKRSKAEIKEAAGSSTNSAFERYYNDSPNALRDIYADTDFEAGKELAKKIIPIKSDK